MNLFEQYGIKEVADVTLYAITLDKYDNEVYVPVIYFDTLKVSTVELSAEQSTARGGLGNSELIVWDYGKEITVNLQDALYTPASQSLIWGGRFNLGKFKIFGAWNPCTRDLLNPSVVDQKIEDDRPYNLVWPKDLDKYHEIVDVDAALYIYQKILKDGPYFMLDFIINGKKEADCAEIIVDSYEDIKIEENIIDENDKKVFYMKYTWKNAILKLVVLDGSKILGYSEPIDICYEELKYHNVNGTLYFSDNNIQKYSLDFYQGFKQIYPIEFQQTEQIIVKRKLGTFYLVEDRNYFNFSKNNIIYLIDYGIQNATKLDRMEEVIASLDFVINTEINFEMYNKSLLPKYSNSNLKFYLNPITMKPYEQNCTDFTRTNGTVIKGSYALIKKGTVYYKWTRDINTDMSLGKLILIDTLHFPGNFKLVGETRSRRRDDGIDERLLFEIPLCKLSSQTSLQLAAEGEPTVYDFSLKVLRPSDGIMMKLTLYKVKKDVITSFSGEKHCSNSTSVISQEKIPVYNNCCPTPEEIEEAMSDGKTILHEVGKMKINDIDLIAIHKENKLKIISVLRDAGMKIADIDALLPPYNINKPLETAYFSTAAQYWLAREWTQLPNLIEIRILSPAAETVYTSPKDFAIPYNNVPPTLLLPTSIAEAKDWLNEINSNPEFGRNKLIVELIYDVVPSSFLTTELADAFSIDFNSGSDGE